MGGSSLLALRFIGGAEQVCCVVLALGVAQSASAETYGSWLRAPNEWGRRQRQPRSMDTSPCPKPPWEQSRKSLNPVKQEGQMVAMLPNGTVVWDWGMKQYGQVGDLGPTTPSKVSG